MKHGHLLIVGLFRVKICHTMVTKNLFKNFENLSIWLPRIPGSGDAITGSLVCI